MPAAGTLRHKVFIQERVDELDEVGSPVDAWQEIATVWASIGDFSGREYLEAAQALINQTSTNILVRYRPGLFPEMRLIEICHYGREYRITGVQPYNVGSKHINDYVLLQCEELRVEVGA